MRGVWRVRDPLAYQRHTTPEGVALIDAETGEEWSYRGFNHEIEKTASRLWSLGVRPGDQIGLLIDTSPAFARLVHATWRIGGVLVPLNTRLSVMELEKQGKRIDLGALIYDESYAKRADRAVEGTPSRSVSGLSLEPHAEFVADVPEFDSPRTMLFTSGTTGEPKAVVLTGRNLLASAVASAFRLGILPDDRWYDPLPGYHMGGLAPIVRSALYGTTVILESEFDAPRAIDHLALYEPTGVSLVPTMLDRMLEAGDLPDSLRFVLTGGAPVPEPLITRCERRNVPIHPTYGMTETTSQISTARPNEAFSSPKRVGRPLAFTRVRAVADGDPLPPGEPGELVVSGPTVMAGYYGDPETTDRAVGSHGYHTGDLGVVERDGSLRVIGRLDDTIITGGENVHPAAVSDVLRDHPAIEAVAVVGVSDPEWGERVAALVVSESESEDGIREFCRTRLADYKRPKTIEFVDSLPRTASGTIDRQKVRELLLECVE